jgi:hypothetical protein
MIVRAIVLGITVDGIDELRALYTYDGRPEFCANYCQWNDARFMLTFTDKSFAGSYCQEIVQRLSQRRLLKQVFEQKLASFPKSCWEVLETINKPRNLLKRTELEQRIAEVLKRTDIKLLCGRPDPAKLVIVNLYRPKAVRALSRNDEGPILVERLPEPTTFEEESDLFRSLSSEPVDAKLAIYAPVAYDNAKQKRDLQAKLESPILKCLEEFANV